MKAFDIDLAVVCGTKKATLSCMIADQPLDGQCLEWRRPAVVVVPGGGYEMVSKREGEPIAYRFLSMGYHAFVLTYTVHDEGGRYPDQLIELATAIDYIKAHAEEWRVNSEEVFAIGFSAGGHLVGNLAVQYRDIWKIAGKLLDCAPKAVGLCYPVIDKDLGHASSHEMLLEGYTAEELEKIPTVLHLQEGVSDRTPPAFIWHTAEDGLVPCSNSIVFAHALAKEKIPFELHIYQNGGHGLSTCDNEVCVGNPKVDGNREWIGKCGAFFRSFCVEKF